MKNCSRKLEFDSAHRVMLHESKCRNLHGHRYIAEITAISSDLDELGRVIDFSVLKSLIGGWIDEYWDHGVILNMRDKDLISFCSDNNWKVYWIDGNPTAEVLSEYLYHKSNELLLPTGIEVSHIKLYETPNCWSSFSSTLL